MVSIDALQRELTLILPTRNEGENIVPQIREILEALPNLARIIVADDDSTDGTREAVTENFTELISEKRLTILWRRKNLGLTPSLREGVLHTKTRFVGWMDCDLSMPARVIPLLLEKVGRGYDVCIGSRFHRGGAQKDVRHVGKDSRAEIILSNFLNLGLKAFLGTAISDFTSGFIVARTDLMKASDWKGSHGEYFIHLMAQLTSRGYRITEVPYTCGNRSHGTSKTFGTFKASMRNSFRYSRAVLGVTGAKITGLRT